jgi:hypothetical protein
MAQVAVNRSKQYEPAQQLDLFAGFAMPEVSMCTPARKPKSRGLRITSSQVAQFALDLRARAEDLADEWAEKWASRPIVHAVVPASQAKMPETRAAASIFDLAYQFTAAQVISGFMVTKESPPKKTKHKEPAIQEQIHTRVIREHGTVRCIRMHHTDTDEWQEREAARRARQRPPKPGTKYKTTGEKLKEVI